MVKKTFKIPFLCLFNDLFWLSDIFVEMLVKSNIKHFSGKQITSFTYVVTTTKPAETELFCVLIIKVGNLSFKNGARGIRCVRFCFSNVTDAD